MQPAESLPILGSEFRDICNRSRNECLRRILSVAAQRAAKYHDLADRHADLVEFIEDAQSHDDGSGEQD